MKYFQEAMLFFKKSEQEKKVGKWILRSRIFTRSVRRLKEGWEVLIFAQIGFKVTVCCWVYENVEMLNEGSSREFMGSVHCL